MEAPILIGVALHAAGWGIVHALCLGPLLAAIAAGTLRLLPGTSPQARYTLLFTALAVMAALPALFGAYVIVEYVEHVDWVRRAGEGIITGEALRDSHRELYVTVASGASARWLGTALATVCVLWTADLVRRLMLVARRWRALGAAVHCLDGRPGAPLQRTFDDLVQELGVDRPIRLVVSSRIHVPMVSGPLNPTVLLPRRMADDLEPRYLRSILAHEIAHVRRGDLLTNVLQRVLECFLALSPASGWISRRLELERECATDELVCRRLAVPRSDYVRALVELEAVRGALAGPSLAFGGHGLLVERARRVAADRGAAGSRGRVVALGCAVLVFAWWGGIHVVRPLVRSSVDIVMEDDLDRRVGVGADTATPR